MSILPAGGRGSPRGLRFPAFLWALLHVPIFLWLYAPSVRAAVRATPEAYRAWLWPTFLPQALLLALVAFALALPAARWPRAYRLVAPGAAGLVTAALALDAKVLDSVGYHLNGFFFQLMLQPHALREAGVPAADVALFLGGGLGFLVLDLAAGAWFIGRFAAPRRTWTLALAVLLLSAGERVYGAVLTYFGGPAVFAAAGTLPLQVPLRMQDLARRVFGPRENDPFAGTGASKRLPAGVDPKELRFTRKPDVIVVLAESLPASHLDARTMPNLWRRAAGGALFTRHYAGASSTNYTLFSLVYGLQAQKLEATVGAGRQPVLFPALADNGYQTKVIAASCVDWMGLKETVFGGVKDVETWCDGHAPDTRDPEMLRSARAFVRGADPDRPVFLFLFFFGTHFNYFHTPEDVVFTPEWDGKDGFKATRAPGAEIENRSRNAAHAVDRRLEAFLRDFEAARGRPPLVFFTGDHGEEFREKGHLGHGSAVTSEQIHVPAVWFGPGVPAVRPDAVTSHVDLVPTLFALLGDDHPPGLYADGISMLAAPRDRYVVATVGWEPEYAAIGRDLKITMYAGIGGAQITDPDDHPLPDGPARMARDAGRIMKALRGEPESSGAAPPPAPAPAPARASR